MRPHKLTMKAFGPFAQENIVDFDAMGNSIYLISGDTGAGKTTIFDGIVYALYGTASGGARSSLGTEAFHSDYEKNGHIRSEMGVELVFSNGGRTYTVSRRMYWGKRGDTQKPTKESVLSENGSIIVFGKGKEDKDDVTAKITEILGLDADQFRRIIMLSQGEFQRFLTAKSDERGAILGRLYDNRQHQDFQYRLKAAAVRLKGMDDALAADAAAQTEMLIFPEWIGKEAREGVTVRHPMQLMNLRAVIERMEEALAQRSAEVRNKESELKKIEAQKTQGETCNHLLMTLEANRKKLSFLESRKDEINALRQKIELAVAAERVLPIETAMHRAEAERMAMDRRVAELEANGERLQGLETELETVFRTIQRENTPKIEQLLQEQANIKSILPLYDSLTESIRRQTAAASEFQRAEAAVHAAAQILEKNTEKRKAVEERLSQLGDAGDFAVGAAKRKCEDIAVYENQLLTLEESVTAIKCLEKELGTLADALFAANKAELAAEQRHLSVNTAFVQGQAGLLAQNMRDILETEEFAVCPVCGSVHSRDDIRSFAACTGEMVTRETVDAAFRAMCAAQEKARETEKKYSVKEETCRLEKTSLLRRAQQLYGENDFRTDWDYLSDEAMMARELEASRGIMADAKTEYQRACADQNEKNRLLTAKKTLDGAIAEGGAAVEAAQTAQRTAETAVAAAQSAVENWKKQLEGCPATKTEAMAMFQSLSGRISLLQKQMEDAKTALSRCQQEQAENDGSLKTARAEQNSRRKAAETAQQEFHAALEKNGFGSPEEFRAAASPEGSILKGDALGAWVSRRGNEISSYDQSRNDIAAAVRQLEESTAEMTYTDVQALAERIIAETDVLNRLRAEVGELSVQIQTDRRVHGRLEMLRSKRLQYRRAYEKLGPLAETANGNYTFSRYVLSGFFRRTVEQANVHLETMTDGEYRLIPTETGDGRRNIGLELKVLNTITNVERETGSLSGGQMFEASLALALGLSDVVQMDSTGSIRIDSMFIDEGFGSLDGERLDKAVEVLQHLSAGKRQIGIISHVARLEECIPKKIRVIPGTGGSSVRTETDA